MAYRFKECAQLIFPSTHEEFVIFDAELTELTGVYQVPEIFQQTYRSCYFQQASRQLCLLFGVLL